VRRKTKITKSLIGYCSVHQEGINKCAKESALNPESGQLRREKKTTTPRAAYNNKAEGLGNCHRTSEVD